MGTTETDVLRQLAQEVGRLAGAIDGIKEAHADQARRSEAQMSELFARLNILGTKGCPVGESNSRRLDKIDMNVEELQTAWRRIALWLALGLGSGQAGIELLQWWGGK